MTAARDPLPEPDLASSQRATNVLRLLRAAAELDAVADAAVGKLVQPDVELGWLRKLAAPRYGAEPDPLLRRWIKLFRDDYEVVRRARNNIVYTEPISDGNLAASAQIAERILGLVKNPAQRKRAG